jgi:LacI family transcriptional regulator
MKAPEHAPPALRIAAVWLHDSMRSASCLRGLYRQAGRTSGLTLRMFDVPAADFTRDVLRSLKEWRPHGVVVYLPDWKLLKALRRQLPGVPVVATVLSPPELVDTNVVASRVELIAVARDYYHACGLRQLALFTLSSEFALPGLSRAFHEAVPGGQVLAYPYEFYEARTPTQKKRMAGIMTGLLRSLPKPVGVLTLETESAPFILTWCRKLGLRVPQDVQIIGVGEEDECLACEPHLTSLELPSNRIGKTAMTAMLQHLRHEPPPPLIRVPGGTVVVRGSTGRVETGRLSVSAVLDRMPSYAAEGLSAGCVASQSGMCRAAFYKEFTAATGDTPARHLRRLRLEESCRLLREDSANVTSIAAACGFKDLVSFSNFFRREMGETPSAYRKRMAGH